MNDQAKVGLVVLVAAGLLITAMFAIANIHIGGKFANYKAYFKFGAGLEPGAVVRYAGLKVGRVNEVRVDPSDKTRVEVLLEVRADTPIRADSLATISALTLLTENYIEIVPGKGAPLADGGTIPSQELQDMNALIRKMSALADTAEPLIVDLRKNLNQISEKADTLLAQLNDVTGEANRKHLAGILAETDGMIKKNSPRIDEISANLSDASKKIAPLLEDLKVSNTKLQAVLDNGNELMKENREPLKAALLDLQNSLKRAEALISQIQGTLTYNSDNIDATLENFRQTSENVRELTDTVRQRPYSLIRVKPLPDRAPPGGVPGNKSTPAKSGSGGK
jgi:phospholipid/cholesterol/gamma-HCH transport system substrate-binding protein